jgi:hypothetical protein
MTNYTLYNNQRGNSNLIHDAYTFNKENRKNMTNEWRCSKKKCSAIGNIQSDGMFCLVIGHNHSNEELKPMRELALAKIKEETKLKNKKTFEIITSVTSNFDDEVIKTLPKFKSMMDNCARIKRKKYDNFNAKFDDIPEVLKTDLTNDKFLQFDSGVHDKKRFLIFFHLKTFQ